MRTLTWEEMKDATEAMIDVKLIKLFIAANCYDIIGKRRDGSDTILLDELKLLGSWHNKIQVLKIKEYEAKKRSFLNVEYNDRERKEIATTTYRLIACKLLWINSVCKALLNECFIKVKIDKNNLTDVINLAEAFAFAINHPEEF